MPTKNDGYLFNSCAFGFEPKLMINDWSQFKIKMVWWGCPDSDRGHQGPSLAVWTKLAYSPI